MTAPTESACARCGRAFGCGAGTGDCWCAELVLDAEASRRIEASYDGCLCPDCLRALADSPRSDARGAPS